MPRSRCSGSRRPCCDFDAGSCRRFAVGGVTLHRRDIDGKGETHALPWIDARLVCRAGLRGLIKEDLWPHDDGFEDGPAGRRSTSLQASVVLGGFDLRLWSSVDWETWVQGMAAGWGMSCGGWGWICARPPWGRRKETGSGLERLTVGKP